MSKSITTIKMLNDRLEADFAEATLELHNLTSATAAEDQAQSATIEHDRLSTEGRLSYINELRRAMGEQPFAMYVEDVEGVSTVFQDIKRQLVPPRAG